MGKKDYTLAAREIWGNYSEGTTKQNRIEYKACIKMFSRVFSLDSPKFNAEKFRKACLEGPKSHP